MAIVGGVASLEAIAAYIAEAGEFATVLEAYEAGVITEAGYGIFVTIEGGAGTAISTSVGTALEVASQGGLAASASQVGTAGMTLAETANGYSLVAMGSMPLSSVAAAVAPLAGFALGANLYQSNPELWTKISQKLLPFCYPGTDKIPTWASIVESTGLWKLLVKAGIVDAMKEIASEYNIGEDVVTTYNLNGATIATSGMAEYSWYADPNTQQYLITVKYGGGICFAIGTAVYFVSASPFELTETTYSSGGTSTSTRQITATGRYTYNEETKTYYYTGITLGRIYESVPAFLGTLEEAVKIIFEGRNQGTSGGYPAGTEPWMGAEAPTVPEVVPIIVVPEPLGPDYQPITEPTVPIKPPAIPLLPPNIDPLPLPAPPDPETEPSPENWPEEEPWPETIPFPWTPPETSPDPEKWPSYIPWPLPENPPEEWPTSPPVPEKWPEEFPTTEPWPASPDDWPEEVPWPDSQPEDWPEEVPWPDSPDDWPDDVPWPVPWPDDWPDDVPWPVPWPDELPYPIPWPWPEPTPTPEPDEDPDKITDPDTEVQPYIDPVPWPYDDPKPESPTDPTPYPDPYKDPSQPDPRTDPLPHPDPEPDPDPTQPNPPPPTGNIEPSPPPIIPLPFSSTTGLISVYHPDQSTLLAFCNWLWVTWQDATIDKIWNNPFDGVITLFELYCTPTDVGTKTIRSGFLDSNISCPIISRYTEIDCGSLGIPEYYGNYLDYSPYSKAYIYLPFIGVVELNVDDIVGHGVNVTYRIDEYNGSCIAMITVAKVTEVNGEDVEYNNVFYQYSGNCAVELPIAGGSQAAIKAGMIEAAAWGLGSVVGGIMSGNSLGQIASGMAYGAASAVHSLVSAKSSVQHSGSFGSSYGAMGIKKPFITIVRPKQLQIANYNELYGYQAHRAVNIGECAGYLRCREVHVLSATASDDEKAKIEELLKTGVYVTE